MSKKQSIFSDYVDKDIIKQIENLYNEMDSHHEFEFMLYNFNRRELGMQKYINILQYMNKRSSINNKIHKVHVDSIDLNYTPDEGVTYRVSIDGIDNINKHIGKLHQYKNHVLLKTFVSEILDGNKEMTILKKVKDSEKMVDMSDINIRTRLAEEIGLTKAEYELLKNIDFNMNNKIILRMKNRISYYIIGNPNQKTFVRIDVTETRTGKNLNKITSLFPRYELEIEIGIENKKSKTPELFETACKEAILLLKIIQQSNFIISNSVEENVVRSYAELASVDLNKTHNLDARKPISLDISHVTDILPDKYSVTDKADGERYFLMILENQVYLISTNLAVKNTGVTLSNKLSKYNNSLVDGEFIFIPKKNRYLFMAFDCMFYCGKNIKNIVNFYERVKHADDIIDNCFIFEGQKGFKIKDYEFKNTFDLNKILEFHDKQIKEYYLNLNYDIEKEKKYPLIRRKYFLNSFGAKQWEIFSYATLLWNKYSIDNTVSFPYTLDGLIFQPLNQAYITSAKESVFFEYKWKPPNKNSIDFYIEIQKNKDTGKELVVYDNSDDDTVSNKLYKICHLMCGSRNKNTNFEEPVLFREEEEGYINNIHLKGNNIVDVEGNLISDKTVVEFYYDADPNIDNRNRWIALRTRYDKTENVLKYKTQFGNFITVANKTWNSIINPILMTDFEDLSKGNDEKNNTYFYDKKINILRKRIGHEQIITIAKESTFAQNMAGITKNMKRFMDYVKSIIMYTYNNRSYQNNRQLSAWDIDFGIGYEIGTYYYNEVAFLVATDTDNISLISATNGALSRYNQFKKNKPGVPDMYFVHADSSALMNYDDQYTALKGMNKDNKDLLEKFFSKEKSKRTLFDRIYCRYNINQFLKNNDTWKNFKTNIRDYLKPQGYFIILTYDAKRITELFKDSDTYTVYYTNIKGEKKKLFEFVNKYGKLNKEIGTGNAVDIYTSWTTQEGTYKTEYLVDLDFITKELLNDCGLERVDTDFYDNIFEMQREFLTNYAKNEELEQTREFFKSVELYYDDKDNINKGCYLNTRLFRYCVFRKKDSVSEKPVKKSEQKGGYVVDFNIDSKDFIIEKIGESNHSFCKSVFTILKEHHIVPPSLECEEFFKELGKKFSLKKDAEIDDLYIDNINNKLSVYHENEKGKKFKKIDGISIIVIEKNCNDELEYTLYLKKNYKLQDKVVVLFKDLTYKPVYRIEDDHKRGLYNMDDTMIEKIINDNTDE